MCAVRFCLYSRSKFQHLHKVWHGYTTTMSITYLSRNIHKYHFFYTKTLLIHYWLLFSLKKISFKKIFAETGYFWQFIPLYFVYVTFLCGDHIPKYLIEYTFLMLENSLLVCSKIPEKNSQTWTNLYHFEYPFTKIQ